jgi:hypothetical protein
MLTQSDQSNRAGQVGVRNGCLRELKCWELPRWCIIVSEVGHQGPNVSVYANTIGTLGATMPAVNLSFEHGQSYDAARTNFEKGITQAQAKFGMFIHKVVWSDDRTSARLTGTGFEVDLRLDESMVHATGHVPIFLRFLEGPIRKFLAKTFKDG